MTFNVACVQISSQNNIQDNLSKVAEFVAEAKSKNAELITLPENVAIMASSGDELIENSFVEDNNLVLNFIKSLASEHNCYLLLGGLAIKSSNSSKLLNRSYLIDQNGNIINYYDKIHLYDVTVDGGETHKESRRYQAGSKATIAKTEHANIGMTICYDIRFAHLYRDLAKAGAHIITVPAAFTCFTGKAHWEVLLRARAIETGCFIVAPAQTGDHPANRQTYGHSLIINPWGEILADAGETEGIINFEIDLNQVIQIRNSMPSLEHDRDYSL